MFTFNGTQVHTVTGPALEGLSEDERLDLDLTFHIGVMEEGGLYWVRRPNAHAVRDYLEVREGWDGFQVLVIVEGEFSHETGENSVWIHR